MEDQIEQDLTVLILSGGSCSLYFDSGIYTIECKRCLNQIKQVCFSYWYLSWKKEFYRKESIYYYTEPHGLKMMKKPEIYEEVIIEYVKRFGKEKLVEILI